MPYGHNIVTGVSEGSRKNLKCAGLDTVLTKDQNLFWLLVNHIRRVEAQKGVLFELPNPTTIVVGRFQKK